MRANANPFKSRYVRLDNLGVHYIDGGEGPALLMLHAAPETSYVYRNFIEGLCDEFRCIAIDFPGFGKSEAPETFVPTLDALSSCLERFMLELDLQDITVLVHDTAGPVALRVAENHPERFRGFILTDTFAWPLSHAPQVKRMISLVGSPLFMALNERFNILARAIAVRGPLTRKLTPDEAKAYMEATPTALSRRRQVLWFRDLIQNERFLKAVEDDLPKITGLPALTIFGEKDPIRRAGFQERFEQVWPNIASVVIDGEGHFPHEGAPRAMVEAIRRWTRSGDVPVTKAPLVRP